jgi:hypothetical protein
LRKIGTDPGAAGIRFLRKAHGRKKLAAPSG